MEVCQGFKRWVGGRSEKAEYVGVRLVDQACPLRHSWVARLATSGM